MKHDIPFLHKYLASGLGLLYLGGIGIDEVLAACLIAVPTERATRLSADVTCPACKARMENEASA